MLNSISVFDFQLLKTVVPFARKLELQRNELLEALRKIEDFVGGESEDPDADIAAMQDIASAAIAKAEGRDA
ncbi:MAG: hypothetical protein QM755_23850 [Luteolibacter sp.]